MPYISVRGVEHYYEWMKKSSQPNSKPVMVFIHGWAGSFRYWRGIADSLSDRFDCLLYDLRGFGRSRGRPTLAQASEMLAKSDSSDSFEKVNEAIEELNYELEEYARDLAVLLENLEIQHVYVHAHSMGSSVGALFINLYPQWVEKAILSCTGIFEYDEKAFVAFHKFGGYVVKFRPTWLVKIPLVDRMFMARFLHRSIAKQERVAFLEDFVQADYEAALGTIFTSVSKIQAEVMPQAFANLTVSTLLISGEYDKIIPAEMGRLAAGLNEILEFVVIPDTGHFPMLEDAATYLKTVENFLS
ncbi:MAG: alpha/beta hydrolase [Scytonematopsis contorta HA4267-MV1]|jgi:proline iminopeptidase|nr:alpha/beta hydrolase [Scytonematopsis contorta HA4267-MV1]